MSELEGLVAVVTGAADGIGKATAELLAARGADLICVDFNHEKLADVCEGLRARGAQVNCITGDVSLVATFIEVRNLTEHKHGKLDILANIAGVWEEKGFDQIDEASWNRIIDINAKSVLFSIKTLTPLLTKSASPRVINVAATDGFRGSKAMPHYAAAKAAVVNLTKSFALELAPRKILVNCVAPGAIATPRAQQEGWLKEREKVVPLGRLGKPEDVAEAIAYLASPRNTFTTGLTMTVNGGLLML